MTCWLLDKTIGIIGILMGAFIAYHVYFLSKKVDLEDRLTHRDEIVRKVEPILCEIRKGISSKCELVNVKKYLTHYPCTNTKNRHGYTYIAGELKALRFDGVEFFSGVRELYETPGGKFSLDRDGNKRLDFNVLEVGVVPYGWIEYIDSGGDEFSYRPQFFVQFRGLCKTPYKYQIFYRENIEYGKSAGPMDMKWRLVEIKK
jgi:hypothetical protein